MEFVRMRFVRDMEGLVKGLLVIDQGFVGV